MSRPRLLDLFGGAGGAAMGYVEAGFDVVSVDIHKRQHLPESPWFTHVTGDALDYLADPARLRTFDVIHASPPCQTHTALVELRKAQGKGTSKLDLIPQTAGVDHGKGTGPLARPLRDDEAEAAIEDPGVAS